MDRTVGPIDELLRERHLLKHPFYVAWSRGELPLDTLRDYAGQYYRFESAFPRFVAAAYARLERPQDRRVLLENLIDEEGRSPTHPELWLDFARGIGLSARATMAARPHPATGALLDCYDRLTQGSAPEAVSALYAYESIFPEIAAEKSRGLRAHYGIRDRPTHEFFRVHTTADVEHSGAERRVLSGLLAFSPAARRAALVASRRAIGAWWSFLDGFPLDAGAAKASA
jgi:pyrroloquinoline-quinone synthase